MRRPVGRPPQPGRREEILTAAVRVAAERGLDDLSLAELATALGFSTYTLTYHFGRREGLLAAIVEHVETEMREQIRRLAEGPGGASPGELLRRYWESTRAPGAHSYMRLWLELLVLAGRHPDRFPGFQQRAATGWRDLAAQVLREHTGSDELATLIVATVTGLEIEQMLDPGSPRPGQALDCMIRLLEQRDAAEGP
ncbi:AcrR family transcriptional regulator [Thermocatellispora tengchongensis]|uniref:AcrR family transcriptional regulator n=1 Tax=Thermocatellispora tengchongensis TaxID=1073253 RepID=A0A840P5W0_9ACTN|nr:TetR/AcrR family transcriptional regulator [Thermocatellispora tengchongensis]MBB5131395.1 AcrR family transcriptional regulator [Thermocatellispora tengchongensis]